MSHDTLPTFDISRLSSFPSLLEKHLNENLNSIEALLKNDSWTFESLIEPLDEIDDKLEQFWSPLSHLHSVLNSKELRACYKACLPKLTAYHTTIGHNEKLYRAVRSLKQTKLSPIQEKIVDDMLEDFELAGVHLDPQEKERLKVIEADLATLSSTFENHVLDATQAFEYHTQNEKELEGLPQHTLETAKELAKKRQKEGWILTLEPPCYLSVVTYLKDRDLRKRFYDAWVTRASEKGPFAGQYDNTPVIQSILRQKQEKAKCLKVQNYAELSIKKKMAQSTEEVIGFLNDLIERVHLPAQKDIEYLQEFAKEHYNLEAVRPWDVAFLSEKMREMFYAITEETLRPYFPEHRVLLGLFNIIEKLYGVHFERVSHAKVWEKSVLCFKLFDKNEKEIGFIYLDLYARANKRGGAWMDTLRSRRLLKTGEIQLPIATLTTNFTPAAIGKEPTLSHDEVLTLFHEFGHCLHHLLTEIDYTAISGIHGVEWDAVELPSQIFENWCYEEEALSLISEHVETKAPLPHDLLEKLLKARRFQAAMQMMRQLELALFDFLLHERPFDGDIDFMSKILKEVQKKTVLITPIPYNRFQHSFSHIFAGGYDAGYYSYLWAEVLAADAFSRFKEEGILNRKTGEAFLGAILSRGSSIPALQAFIEFQGRPPKLEPLLEQYGIR